MTPAAPPRRCDFCKAGNAAFGYAPPPRLAIAIRRPIWTCADPACRQAAEDRRGDLMARHDPLAAARARPRDPGPDPAPGRDPGRDPAQAALDI